MVVVVDVVVASGPLSFIVVRVVVFTTIELVFTCEFCSRNCEYECGKKKVKNASFIICPSMIMYNNLVVCFLNISASQLTVMSRRTDPVCPSP